MDSDRPQQDKWQAGSIARGGFSPAWLSMGLSFVLAGTIWITLYRFNSLTELQKAPVSLALVILLAVLTATTERSLRGLVQAISQRYRLAFLTSLGVGWAYWLVLRLFILRSPGAWVIFLVWLGAFAGGLLTTGLNNRLWENNSPPGQQVQDEVLRLHRRHAAPPLRTALLKRFFDVSLALAGLVLASPVWLVCLFGLWMEDPGPVLFVKNSVGKGGQNFRQFKFRTMVRGAEDETGPVLSSEGDERVLVTGKLLRKSALDELPQLINILKGEMSFVGPRPQRTILVLEYLNRLPEYAERHRVLPGLSGLAQIAGDYYLTPHQKLRLDRLYIRHADFGFDLKLLGLAFLITFWYRWKKSWNGRLPRRLIRLGASSGS